MKVIKPGRPPKEWSMRVLCSGNGNGGGGCNATLEIVENDIYVTRSEHYDGSIDFYFTIKCCECGVESDISEFSIPHKIKDNIRIRSKPLSASG